MKDYPEGPITVLGMHRSGTTLVAKLLDACNVWMGYNFNANFESLFFVRINKRLLRQQGEYWHSCEETLANVENERVLRNWKKYVDRKRRWKLGLRHFGVPWLQYAFRSKISQQRTSWGWKDPRTTLLFPLWKMVYPHIRIVGVIRNPRDVCISLYYRELRRYQGKVKHGRTDLSFEFLLSRNFEIWKLYTRRVIRATQRFPEASVVFRYEELSSEQALQRLCAFVGVHCDFDDLISLISYRASQHDDPPGIKKLEEILASDPLVFELGYG